MNARVASFVVVASLALACGGSTAGTGGGGGGGSGSGSGSGSGGGSGSGSGSSSGGGPGAGPCPSTAPSTTLSAPTSCASSLEGVSCEYGNDPDLSCNTLVTCTQGTWTNATSSPSQSCPTPAATGACPSTYSAAESAGACTQTGLACGYAQGRCDCAKATGGPPTVGLGSTRWLCDDAPSGCPSPRPHVGSECTSSSVPSSCNYGACSIPDGITLACTGGTWQVTQTACAL